MSDIESEQVPDAGDHRDRSGFAWIVAVELAILLFVGLGVATLIRGASAADPDHAVHVPTAVTVSLAALPSETSDMYRYVAAHGEQFTEFPCYCGCDRSLGHRDLRDCFVTPDGSWDAHASGCGVCTAEATTAKELLADGTEVATVRQKIIDRYGPPPAAKQGAQP